MASEASEKVDILPDHLKAASEMAKAMSPGSKPFQYLDKNVKNLRLIVQPGRATWYVRHGHVGITLGTVYPANQGRKVETLSVVRDAARAAKALLAVDKERAAKFVMAFQSGETIPKSILKANEDVVVEDVITTWTLMQCFEQSIQDKRQPSHKNHIGEQAEKDIRITMSRECFQTVLAKPAVKVTADDIEAVRDEVKRLAASVGQSGISPSNKIITHTRAVLDYCATHHRGRSGLGDTLPWWKMIGTIHTNSPKTRKPSIEDVVKTMLIAERYIDKPLPGRKINAAGVSHATLAGLWWIILTAQRANAGLSLLPYNIGPDLERPDSGWLIAAWDADIMKAGQSFVLPIPARAWAFIESFRQKGKHLTSEDWVFASDFDAELHATPSGIYRVVYRLAARDDPEQKPKPGDENVKKKPRKALIRTERVDLLAAADIEWWSMHDLRRTLADFMISAKIPGGASAILAHEVSEKEMLRASTTDVQRADFRRQRTAKITQMAYGGESQFIDLKSEAMVLWTDAILDEYERQKSAAT